MMIHGTYDDNVHPQNTWRFANELIDANITFGDLKGTLADFARGFFGPDTKVKFIPHYFPFTET